MWQIREGHRRLALSYYPGSLERVSAQWCTETPLRMVWIDNWDTFYSEAEKLFLEHPAHVSLQPCFHPCAPFFLAASSDFRLFPTLQTRYVTKYRHVDGKLELKVTNDRVCLKFLTDQQQDLKRVDKLNSLLLTYMVGKDPYDEPSEVGKERPTSGGDKQGSADDSAVPQTSKKKKAKR